MLLYLVPLILLTVALLPSILMLAFHIVVDALGYPAAIRAFKDLELSGDIERAAIRCFDDARARQRSTWLTDSLAPIATFIALIGLPREAERLPAWARRWDNEVSLNGDGYGWQDSDGTWYDTRIKPVPTGKLAVSHQDPAYGGDTYYAKGHHPRSFIARWIWVGWRNRASLLSQQLGEFVDSRPMVFDAEPPEPHRANRTREGWYLMRHGDLWQFREFEFWGPVCVIRNLGFKLEIIRNSPDGYGTAAATAIGWSFKRRRD